MNTLENNKIGLSFIFVALIYLLIGLFFGFIGSLQYISTWIDGVFPFYKTRPLHVYTVLSFIIMAAVGGVYHYLHEIRPLNSKQILLGKIHFWVFFLNSIGIIISFLWGIFGGREYLEFHPIFSLPILVAWLIFAFNYVSIFLNLKPQNIPIYFWMWGTGILFFIITNLEACAWLFPFINQKTILDITIQWKSLGSMVGAWNMLIYGTVFYLMEKISGDTTVLTSKKTFFFYFLGFTNLMFNWGHHLYPVPNAYWLRMTAYAITMTELLILFDILYLFKKSLQESIKNYNHVVLRFLSAADIWILLNLTLALCISVPAINKYTHGTHFTVAHAMGTTIGINSSILFASLFNIYLKLSAQNSDRQSKKIEIAFWLLQISLLIFWCSLLAAGFYKSYLEQNYTLSYGNILEHLYPIFVVFCISGLFISIAFITLVLPILSHLYKVLTGSKKINSPVVSSL